MNPFPAPLPAAAAPQREDESSPAAVTRHDGACQSATGTDAQGQSKALPVIVWGWVAVRRGHGEKRAHRREWVATFARVELLPSAVRP